MFVLIIISDLDLTAMCPHLTELPNKTPQTPMQQSLNHIAKMDINNKFDLSLSRLFDSCVNIEVDFESS